MVTTQSFIAEIEAFLEETDTSASAFGKAAVGDPCFVSDLKDGRSVGLRLIEKANGYIAAQRKALRGKARVAAQ